MKIQFPIPPKTIVSIALAAIFYLSPAAITAQRSASIIRKGSPINKDTVSSIVKYRIKAIIMSTYKSDDSTMSAAKLDSKVISTYNHAGLETSFVDQNSIGKAMNKTEITYDNKNNVTESASYDSLNKIINHTKYSYDDLNRLIESSSSEVLGIYEGKPADAGKYVIYSYKNKYDANGNAIETISDSAGVIISRTVSKFDEKKRVTNSEQYEHKTLTRTMVYNYDSKGGSTSTTEFYQNAGRSQCSPNKNRTVSKFDSKGNMILSLSTSEENGAVSTTKTTGEYKYLKDKLLSAKTITETNSESFTSKSTNQESFKYDASGNMIESVYKYGGGGGSTTERFKYNGNNSVIEEITYSGTCMDKPSSVLAYSYYPDGIRLKETKIVTFDYPSKSIEKLDERSLTTENFYFSPDESRHVVYQYEYWPVE